MINEMYKKIIFTLLKLSLAGGLLYWLWQSGKLDLKLIEAMIRHPRRLALAFMFCVVNLVLVSFRWRYLLRTRSQQAIPMTKLTLMNWIGLFFSSVLPGSVTGDLVKILYVQQLDASLSKAFILFVTLLDRAMGLAGLILLMGVMSAFNYSSLLELSPKLEPLLWFNFAMFATVLVALILYFKFPQVISWLLSWSEKHLPAKGITARFKVLWDDLIQARQAVAGATLISIVVQFTGVVIFWVLVSPFFTTGLSLLNTISFIPLGFMSMAFPVAPGGLGVGHAVFESLFALAGEINGANFFNSYFLVTMSFNLLGVVPYLFLRTKK